MSGQAKRSRWAVTGDGIRAGWRQRFALDLEARDMWDAQRSWRKHVEAQGYTPEARPLAVPWDSLPEHVQKRLTRVTCPVSPRGA